MKFQVIGRIVEPAHLTGWMRSHAAYPTPYITPDGTLRIFFSSRDPEGRGGLLWCDLAPSAPFTPTRFSDGPIVSPGPPGGFDDSGLGVGNLVESNGSLFLYYLGISAKKQLIPNNAIGIAECKDLNGIAFQKKFDRPVLSRSRFDPYTLSYPFVFKSGRKWIMFYGTNKGDLSSKKDMNHVLTYAESSNGIDWTPTGRTILDLRPGEFALGRPWMINRDDGYLLYTIYEETTRIGIAKRDANGRWRRFNDDLVRAPGEAWARESVSYASHIQIEGRDIVFFCGNRYGKDGFGYGILHW